MKKLNHLRYESIPMIPMKQKNSKNRFNDIYRLVYSFWRIYFWKTGFFYIFEKWMIINNVPLLPTNHIRSDYILPIPRVSISMHLIFFHILKKTQHKIIYIYYNNVLKIKVETFFSFKWIRLYFVRLLFKKFHNYIIKMFNNKTM